MYGCVSQDAYILHLYSLLHIFVLIGHLRRIFLLGTQILAFHLDGAGARVCIRHCLPFWTQSHGNVHPGEYKAFFETFRGTNSVLVPLLLCKLGNCRNIPFHLLSPFCMRGVLLFHFHKGYSLSFHICLTLPVDVKKNRRDRGS